MIGSDFTGERWCAAFRALKDGCERRVDCWELADQIANYRCGRAKDQASRLRFTVELIARWRLAGGSLRASRDPKTGVPSGPFVRFLTAALSLAMDDAAPAPETVYKRIRAQRREYAKENFGVLLN